MRDEKKAKVIGAERIKGLVVRERIKRKAGARSGKAKVSSLDFILLVMES